MSVPVTENLTETAAETTAPLQEQSQSISESVVETEPVVESSPEPSPEEVAVELNKTVAEGDYVKPLPTAASDDDPIEADPEKDEIQALLENPNGPFELSSGTAVVIRQMKLREFLRLLKIISRGAGAAMAGVELDFNNPDEFAQSLLMMVLLAVPEAENETIDFIQAMVEPANLSKDKKVATDQLVALYTELDNPEMEDMINILGVIVASEGRDLQKLGKRLRSMFSVASKMGLTGNLKTTNLD